MKQQERRHTARTACSSSNIYSRSQEVFTPAEQKHLEPPWPAESAVCAVSALIHLSTLEMTSPLVGAPLCCIQVTREFSELSLSNQVNIQVANVAEKLDFSGSSKRSDLALLKIKYLNIVRKNSLWWILLTFHGYSQLWHWDFYFYLCQ